MKDALEDVLGAETEAAAAAIITAEAFKGEQFDVELTTKDGEQKVPFLLRNKNALLDSLHDLTEKALPTPFRPRQTVTVQDQASLIGAVNRFKSDKSVIFADISRGTIEAVLDFHDKAQEGTGWGQYRIRYEMPKSDQWKVWSQHDRQNLNQIQFAEHIEDNIFDLMNPYPGFVDPDNHELTERQAKLKEIADLTRRSYGSVAQMMDASRGLKVHSEEEAGQIVNLQTGANEFVYNLKVNQQAADGQRERVEVPGLFLIKVPVFENGDFYEIPVKLNFRTKGGISWIYEVYQRKQLERQAFDDVIAVIRKDTALPVFTGVAGSQANS